MICNIAFEKICENYWYGAYGEFKVVLMKDNGYINATKMCADGGKKFKNWRRNAYSTALISALESMLGTDEVLDFNKDNSVQAGEMPKAHIRALVCKCITADRSSDVGKIISGTYIHPDLVPSVAGWISPSFQLKANRVVNGYITAQYQEHLDNANQALTISQQQLSIVTQEFSNQSKALNINNIANHLMAKQVEKFEQQTQNLKGIVEQNERQHEVWSSTHGFTLMRLNNPDAKLPYYAIRRKSSGMTSAINKVKAKHPHCIMVYENTHVANPVNLYLRLKNSGILGFKGNYCCPLVSEMTLITKLGELCNVVQNNSV